MKSGRGEGGGEVGIRDEVSCAVANIVALFSLKSCGLCTYVDWSCSVYYIFRNLCKFYV